MKRAIKYIIFIILIFVIGYKLYNSFFEEVNIEKESETTQIEQERYDNELNIALIALDTFNPILTKNTDVINITKLTNSSLFDIDRTGSVYPVLVGEYSTNQNIITVNLKKDILWQDGTNLTSEDVKYTVDTIKYYGGIYYKNVENIQSIEIINDRAFSIVLNKPNVQYIESLTFPIISEAYYRGEDLVNTSKNSKPYGNGKYICTGTSDNTIILTKNLFYFDKYEPKFTKINIKKYSSIGEAFSNFKTNKIDIIDTRLLDYDKYIGKIGYNVNEYITNEYMCLALNKSNSYISNKVIRKAIDNSIDKNYIANEIFAGKFVLSNSILSPDNKYYKEWVSAYNTETAKKYLIENGYTGKIQLNLLVNSTDEKDLVTAINIKNNLEKLGMEISIIKSNYEEYYSRLSMKDYDMALVNFNFSNNFDISILNEEKHFGIFKLSGDAINNYAYEMTNSFIDSERKRDIYYSIQNILEEEIPYIGLGFKEKTLLYKANIIGIKNIKSLNLYSNLETFYKNKN